MHSRFHGGNIQAEVEITFKEAMEGVDKEIGFTRDVKCEACDGTREDKGSSSSDCYSCKG